MPNPTIAYIAEGKLYSLDPAGTSRLFESRFAQELIDRDERQRRKDGWKQESAGWQATSREVFMAGQMGLGGMAQGRVFRITSVAGSDTPGHCLFALHTNTVGGLFELRLPDDERRLVHQPNFDVRGLARHTMPGGERMIACSITDKHGAVNLGIMREDGGRLQEITEGDSIDESPAWVPIPGKVLLYQSAGIARDGQGMPRAFSPYRIERLDLDRGTLETLGEDPEYDYLLPRMDEHQTLHYIRRPYRPTGYQHVPLMVRLKYIALWPFGVLAAIGAFLNVFSTMFRGKPLTPAGGPKPGGEGPDARQMFLWGRSVAAERVINDTKQAEQITVPRDWELIREDATGTGTVLARGVASYDLGPDGSLVYCDGSKIVLRDPDGETRELARHALVEQVAWVPADSDDA